jgi:hypothetical protein
MNIDGDLRLIRCFIDTAAHCRRRKNSFHTVCAISHRRTFGQSMSMTISIFNEPDPAGLLQLLIHVQNCCTRRDVDEKNVFAGIKSYASKYFLPEIKDELVGYIDQIKVDNIFMALSSITKRKFNTADVSDCLSDRGILKDTELNAILNALFNCSAIGNVVKDGNGHERFSFKYRNRHAFFTSNEEIILHRGLSKAMNINWS